MRIEETWPVFRGDEQVGSCEVSRQGLYLRFQCRCSRTPGKILRLVLRMPEEDFMIGVPVPDAEGLLLDTCIAAKKLREPENFRLLLLEREEIGRKQEVPANEPELPREIPAAPKQEMDQAVLCQPEETGQSHPQPEAAESVEAYRYDPDRPAEYVQELDRLCLESREDGLYLTCKAEPPEKDGI